MGLGSGGGDPNGYSTGQDYYVVPGPEPRPPVVGKRGEERVAQVGGGG